MKVLVCGGGGGNHRENVPQMIWSSFSATSYSSTISTDEMFSISWWKSLRCISIFLVDATMKSTVANQVFCMLNRASKDWRFLPCKANEIYQGHTSTVTITHETLVRIMLYDQHWIKGLHNTIPKLVWKTPYKNNLWISFTHLEHTRAFEG